MAVRKQMWFWGFAVAVLSGSLFADPFSLDRQQLPNLDEVRKYVQDSERRRFLLLEGHGRPTKCPLQALDNAGLVQRLKSIFTGMQNGKCRDKHKDFIDGIGRLATYLGDAYVVKRGMDEDLFNDDYQGLLLGPGDTIEKTRKELAKRDAEKRGDAEADADTADADSTLSDRARAMMGNMTKIARDEQCLEDFRQHGLLSVFADLSTSIGQVAMSVPTPNGLMTGAAAMAVGATLDVINGLLSSPFDWDQEGDRNQFISLNCDFLDVRRELEESDFFRIRDDSVKKKVARTSALIKEIQEQQEKFVHVRRKFATYVEGVTRAYHASELGLAVVQFSENVDGALTSVSTLARKDFSSDDQLQFILAMAKRAPQILSNFFLTTTDFPYADFVRDLLNDFDVAALRLKDPTYDGIRVLAALKPLVFRKTYVAPLQIYLRDALEAVRSKREAATARFLDLTNPDGVANRAILAEGEKSLNDVAEELRKIEFAAQRRLAVLHMSENKRSLDSTDEGAHTTYDIIQEYRDIEKLIFGQRGWDFVSFLLKDANRNHKRFKSRHKTWVETYPHPEGTDVAWACRDAQRLRVYWDAANAGVELIDDFNETNKGIFSSSTAKFRWAFHVLPIARSFESKLYRSMVAAQLAKRLLAGDATVDEDEIRSLRGWPNVNLGILILDLKRTEPLRRQVEDFMERAECVQYF